MLAIQLENHCISANWCKLYYFNAALELGRRKIIFTVKM